MKTFKTLFELQADVCKTLASPKRLEIISVLKDGEKSVGELVEILGVPKAAIFRQVDTAGGRAEGQCFAAPFCHAPQGHFAIAKGRCEYFLQYHQCEGRKGLFADARGADRAVEREKRVA